MALSSASEAPARAVVAGDRVPLRFGRDDWTGFAAAYVAVRAAGATAVLISPGATPARVRHALEDASALGSDGSDDDLLYPAAPLALGPLRLRAATSADPVVSGRLVHAWAPGSVGGHYALGVLLARGPDEAVGLPTFDPDRLFALAARHGATTIGLTPALAAALVASGTPAGHDTGAVTSVLLTGRPSARLRAGLAAAFPGAEVVELDVPASPQRRQTAPAAVSQLGMLWHEQFAPGSFNLPCLVRRYNGPLDVAGLRWALSELIRRHEPLRTTFHVAGGEALQTVRDPANVPLDVVDLSSLAPAARDEEIARRLSDASSQPFDLVRGPLFEPGLIRLGPDDHLLVIRLHHTVFDDWSVDVFRRELSALYTAAREGAPDRLPEPATALGPRRPATTFSTFARRQRDRLAGEAGTSQRAWWRDELRGAPLSTQLALGRGSAGPLRLDLPADLAAGLRALSPRLRATPFMTALAAFSVLLHRATGQDDLLLATVVAHRNRTELEALIGCFTKKVPLRLKVDSEATFAEVVTRTRNSLLGALAHQDVAFDEAVQEGVGEAAARHGVVPQVAVVFQGETPQVAKLQMPGLTVSAFEVSKESRQERHFSAGPDRSRAAWGDGLYLGSFLILSLLETPEGLAFIERGVFDPVPARRLLDDFEVLLAEVLASPDVRVAALGSGPPSDGRLPFRGFRIDRARLEAALATCPGVAEVTVTVTDEGGELVAAVVPEPDAPAPSRHDLRHALWHEWPGSPWPAVPDAPAVPDPLAAMLAAMWEETAGRPAGPDDVYWQDFSFLAVLAEAREAGLDLPDEDVARCRTLEMLAAAAGLRGVNAHVGR